MNRLLPALAASLSLLGGVAVANAASTPAAQSTKPPAYADPVIADANAMRAADQLHHTNLRQQLENQLQKDGYTDVKITPSSFYIQAKDKKGELVAMIVGPDSFVEVTDVPAKSANAQPAPAGKMGAMQQPTEPQAKKQ